MPGRGSHGIHVGPSIACIRVWVSRANIQTLSNVLQIISLLDTSPSFDYPVILISLCTLSKLVEVKVYYAFGLQEE